MDILPASRQENQLSLYRFFIIILLLGFGLTFSLIYTEKPIFIIGGILALLSGLVLFSRPRLATYLIIFSFPFLSTLPRGAYVPFLKLDELLIIVFFAISFLVPGIKNRFRFTRIDIAFFFVFLAGSVLPFLGVLYRGQSPDWFEAVALLKPIILYRLILLTVGDRRSVSMAVVLLLTASVLVSMLAVLQLLDFANIRSFLAGLYYDSSAPLLVTRPDLFRATSTLGNWNALGGYAALGAILSLALLPHSKSLGFPALMPIALAANLSSLILSGSSSSIIGFLIGAFVLWRLKSRRIRSRGSILLLTFLLVILIGGVAFAVAGKDVLQQQVERQISQDYVADLVTGEIHRTYGLPRSIVSRWYLINYLFNKLFDDKLALLVGFGPGSTGLELLPTATAESGYMVMLFFYGMVFVISYFYLYRIVYIHAKRTRVQFNNKSDLGYALATAGMVFTVAIVVMNIIHAYYTAAGVSHYYWIIVASMMAMLKKDNEAKYRS